MPRTQQKNLVLILARELATNLATAMFVIDPDGTLLYYNEPAEEILGRTYAQAGPLAPGDWGTMWRPETLEGEPIPVDDLPLMRALNEHRTGYMPMRITGLDGVKRGIEVTALPLFARADQFVGAVAIFWELGA